MTVLYMLHVSDHRTIGSVIHLTPPHELSSISLFTMDAASKDNPITLAHFGVLK